MTFLSKLFYLEMPNTHNKSYDLAEIYRIPVSILSILQALFSFIHLTALKSKYYYSSHLTHEESEDQTR